MMGFVFGFDQGGKMPFMDGIYYQQRGVMKASTDPQSNDTEIVEDTAQADNISYLCMKYNRHQQGDHIACQDPKLYCKFRSQCLIHYTEKRNRRKSESAEG
jgi:hypothetical protein